MGESGNAIGLEQSVALPGEGDASEAEAKLYHLYDKDIQGSTTSLLASDGTGALVYEYTDFGETTIHEPDGNQAENEICYTSGIYDESTGLYYLNARYYDPNMGVFLTEDSYRGETGSIDTWNLYAYCNGNPVNYVDSIGHVPKKSTPPPKDSGYKPPKGGAKRGKSKTGYWGWVDKYGNVWVPDPTDHGVKHWDVQGKKVVILMFIQTVILDLGLVK